MRFTPTKDVVFQIIHIWSFLSMRKSDNIFAECGLILLNLEIELRSPQICDNNDGNHDF
ncbi:hypothetical protein [Nostoc sp.]|uniref:hypothetical protein n=1 Tax=Nostoc sp. TaxID=1180 RepID=UPI002FFB97C1